MQRSIISFLCFFSFLCCVFAQENEILINSKFKSKEIGSNFVFTNQKNISLESFLALKNLSFFNNNSILENKKLWLKTKIKNTENDTLFLVLSVRQVSKTKIFYVDKNQIQEKNIGYLVNSDKIDFNDDRYSANLELLPNQEKEIVIEFFEDLRTSETLEINLQTKEQYNIKVIEKINKYNYLYVMFSLLSGGILIMFLYNLLLFFQYREKIYLYYSLHLFFTLINYLMVCDGFHKDFTGQLNQYTDLILENTYALSFLFYTTFIYSILEKNSKVFMRRLVYFYIGFIIAYLVSVNIVFFNDNQKIINNFVYVAFLFRIISIFYSFLIIYTLFRTQKKNDYLKYILLGTIVLVSSYFLHVIFNLITNHTIGNHYFNLVGSLIEILFFTYALNLRKKLAEKERDVLKEMNVFKSRFFANISHEFRTPLTLIKSPVQSLQAEIKDENQRNKLDLIDKNSNRMLELVDQLLELSKIDSGKLQLLLKEGNVFSFLASIAEPFEFKAKECNFIFETNIEKTNQNYYFDKDVVEKIVTNLLSNALKYTNQNETINFNSNIVDNQLKLMVSNSGSEIKKEDLPKLFERFYQNNENKQGVGIGLALVKELVELYQGKIETNVENGILSFSVFLPLEKSNENAILVTKQKQEIIEEINLESDNELPILLLVDDNAEIRSVLKDIFKDNYQILEAEDGLHALKIAQTAIPDCIVSDVMMPKMDGFEFTKSIKSNELTSFIPVILLTAKTSDESHLEGLKSTADAYLTKPFNNQIVAATVSQLITERKKLQERYSQELVLKPTDIVINSVDEKFIQRLQKALDENVSNPDYSSDDFAKDAGMSRMQLHRKLKTLFGVSSTEFLRNERLKIAAELLLKGNGNISDVVYAVGFNDVSYFSKCFKEKYECTPSEFVDRNKA